LATQVSLRALAAGVAMLVCVSAWADEAPTETQLGKTAPMFRLPVYNADAVGATAVGLDQYVGMEPTDTGTRAVLLSFMASFCKPCKKEMPYLQKLHEKYKEAGLRVVLVSIDGEPEGQKQIEELVKQHKVTFPVLKDRFQLVGRRWLGTQTPLPSLFILKPDGTIQSVHRGYDKDASVLLAKEVEVALGLSLKRSEALAAE
jgi:thiol-disulfide isomerase/thioredoxin